MNPIDVLLFSVASPVPSEVEAKWRFAVQHDLALPLSVFIRIGLVKRSTVFRDRSNGLLQLRVVNGRAAVTVADLAQYLLKLQDHARDSAD